MNIEGHQTIRYWPLLPKVSLKSLLTPWFILGGPQIQILETSSLPASLSRTPSKPSRVKVRWEFALIFPSGSSLNLKVRLILPFSLKKRSCCKVMGWMSSKCPKAAKISNLKSAKGFPLRMGLSSKI